MIQLFTNSLLLILLSFLPACTSVEGEKGADSKTSEQARNSFARYQEEKTEVKPGPVDMDAPEEFTTTKSGLKYRIRRKTDGAKPKATDTVTVHYKGWLDDGTEFDSSYKRGDPATFPLNRVVAGWTEGLQHVPVGGMIELEIPSKLGYGTRGAPPTIPPGATLHFLVELKSIR
jgi:FKBP-type peptidyl-prolyl cis-trans isomerase FkpA